MQSIWLPLFHHHYTHFISMLTQSPSLSIAIYQKNCEKESLQSIPTLEQSGLFYFALKLNSQLFQSRLKAQREISGVPDFFTTQMTDSDS